MTASSMLIFKNIIVRAAEAILIHHILMRMVK